jgi:hypothetical protein
MSPLEQPTCTLLAACGAFGDQRSTPVRRQDRQSDVSLSLLVRLAHIQRLRKVCIAGLCGVIYRLQHRAMGCGVDWMSTQVVADC